MWTCHTTSVWAPRADQLWPSGGSAHLSATFCDSCIMSNHLPGTSYTPSGPWFDLDFVWPPRVNIYTAIKWGWRTQHPGPLKSELKGQSVLKGLSKLQEFPSQPRVIMDGLRTGKQVDSGVHVSGSIGEGMLPGSPFYSKARGRSEFREMVSGREN